MFSLEFTNNSPYGAAARFFLDGISSFAFTEFRMKSGQNQGEAPSRWLVSPGQIYELPGWQLREKKPRPANGAVNFETEEFVFGDYEKSKARMLGREQNVGMLTVAVHAFWPRSQSAPSDEYIPPPKVEQLSGGPQNGVGGGNVSVMPARVWDQPTNYGRIRSVITIRYKKQ